MNQISKLKGPEKINKKFSDDFKVFKKSGNINKEFFVMILKLKESDFNAQRIGNIN